MTSDCIGMGFNEYGTAVSVYVCAWCGDQFTVCPPTPMGFGGCQVETCTSYKPGRDAGRFFRD